MRYAPCLLLTLAVACSGGHSKKDPPAVQETGDGSQPSGPTKSDEDPGAGSGAGSGTGTGTGAGAGKKPGTGGGVETKKTLNVDVKLKSFHADGQEYLFARVDMGGEAFTLVKNYFDLTGVCVFKAVAEADKSYSVYVQSPRVADCRTIFRATSADGKMEKDLTWTAEAIASGEPLPPDPVEPEPAEPEWKSFSVVFGGAAIQMEMKGNEVRMLDYPLEFKSSALEKAQNFDVDCAKLEAFLKSSPPKNIHLQNDIRLQRTWVLGVRVPSFSGDDFIDRILNEAKKQNPHLTSVNVLNLPTMTAVKVRLDFKDSALSHYLGTGALVNLLNPPDPASLLHDGTYEVGMKAKDLLCDIQMGRATWILEFQGSFKEGDETKEYNPQLRIDPNF